VAVVLKVVQSAEVWDIAFRIVRNWRRLSDDKWPLSVAGWMLVEVVSEFGTLQDS